MQRANKRLRVFAGPNGSGKSTLFSAFKRNFNPGYFINADDLEIQLNISGIINLRDVNIKASVSDLKRFSELKVAKTLFKKAKFEGSPIHLEVSKNYIIDKSENTHSYSASFIAAFIRWLLFKNNRSFSFETVMSHISKVNELKRAQKEGYKTYLYFVCTDNPQINIDRVANRVVKGGHSVANAKIKSRFPETLQNLYPAIKYSNRAYLFDNSGKEIKLISEIFEGVMQIKSDELPNWFVKYVLPNFK